MSKNLTEDYPKGYESTVGYVNISNEKTNQWINECIEKLEQHETLPMYSISSGDTIVIVHRYNRNRSKYKVIVSHGYAEKLI